jgi:hypothetical protein
MSNELTWWNGVASVLVPSTSLLTAFFIYATVRFGFRHKQLDAVMHDHSRFDELQQQRLRILVAQREIAKGGSSRDSWSRDRLAIEVEIFFDRFWSLQFDSHIAWYNGYIPSLIYTQWLFARWRELRKASDGWKLDTLDLGSSLGSIKERWQRNPDRNSRQSMHLSRFLRMIGDLSAKDELDIDEVLREYGPRVARRWFRKFFGAY